VRTVKLPNHPSLSFPDETPDSVIDEVVQRDYKHLFNKQPEESQEQSEELGFKGILKDILNSASNTPNPKDLLSSLIKQVGEGGHQIISDPLRALESGAIGVVNLVPTVLNTIPNVVNYLNRKAGSPISGELPQLPFYKREGEVQPGDEFLENIAGFMPLFKGAGLINKLGNSGKAITAASTQALGRNEDPLQAVITTALLEGGGKVIGGSAKQIKKLNKLNPFSDPDLGKHLSVEELENNLRAAGNTNVPLGRVVESPKLTSLLEKYLVNTPFSGLRENVLHDLKSQIENSGKNLVEKLKPAQLNDHPDTIIKSLIEDSRRKVTAEKNRRYDLMSDIADREKFKLDLSNAEKFAKQNAKAIEESPILRTNKNFKKLYNTVLGFTKLDQTISGKIIDVSGNPLISTTKTPTITQANTVANDLYHAGEQLVGSATAGERYTGGQLIELSNKIRTGVNDSIEKTGSKELQTANSEAKDYYKKNFIDVKDKELNKLGEEGIAHKIIKPNKQLDKVSLIKKVQKQLPADQQNLLGYAFLKSVEDAEGNINPKLLSAQLSKLGPRQLNELFKDPNVRQEILDFGKLRGMGEEGLNVMFNPKTGHQTMPFLIMNALGTIGGDVTSGPVGSAIGNAVAILAGSKIAEHYGNKLTSPQYREKIVRKLIEKKQKSQELSSKEQQLLKNILKNTGRSAILASQTQAQQERR